MTSILPKQNLGKDFNHFERINVTAVAFGEYADTQFKFRCSNMSFSLVWEGTGTIEYSFNGNTVHGDMQNGVSTATLIFENRVVPGIWFRVKSGSGGNVRIEGWAK